MKKALKENLELILFTGIIMPVSFFIFEKTLFPDVIEHIVKRLPLSLNNAVSAVFSIIAGTFLEELIYRQVIQYLLTKLINAPAAIIISSVISALMHRSPGTFAVVFLDLSGIFVDSVLYGIIFKRSNILFSWTAHCLSDLTALFLLLKI